jgi:hypothetical protein
MATFVYDNAKKLFMQGDLDWVNDTFKVLLLGDAGAGTDAGLEFVSEVSGEELDGTGYTPGFAGSGRKALASKSVLLSDGKAQAQADDLTWAAIDAGTAYAAVVYKPVTNDADSLLIAFVDFADTVTNGGDFDLNWPADGVFYLG